MLPDLEEDEVYLRRGLGHATDFTVEFPAVVGPWIVYASQYITVIRWYEMHTIEDKGRFALPMPARRPVLIFFPADWRAGGQLIHSWATRMFAMPGRGEHKLWSHTSRGTACVIALDLIHKTRGVEDVSVITLPFADECAVIIPPDIYNIFV